MATRLLMCPPTYFGVHYSINPWMSEHIGYTAPEARRQWDRLIETMQVAGDVQIFFLEPVAGLPDLVFTANAALVSGMTAVISTFRFAERQAESSIFRNWFAKAGYRSFDLGEPFFEGAGDALFDRRKPVLYMGYGRRTSVETGEKLAEALHLQVIPLELHDDRFYHLDVAFCPLSTGHAMAYMDAFTPASRDLLHRTLGEEELLIEVSLEDALQFACNAVEIAGSIILHAASQRLRERLSDLGYRVFSTDLSEFLRAGGSAKCLTLKLDDGTATNARLAVP
jgi:N-dimethylarginine dimethylaminohydrolase